jgi:nitrous oxidase accessory protein NosD
LQAAINDASCLTVHAAVGTYREQLVIARSLTLAGSNGRETFIEAPASMSDPRAIVRVTGRRVKVKIKHFTIRGPGAGNALVGVLVDSQAKVTVRDSHIKDIRQEPLGGSGDFIAIHAKDGLPATAPTLTVDGDSIQNYQGIGILVEGPTTSASIVDSVIAGPGTRPAGGAGPVGIWIRNGAAATVSRNDVVDNRADPSTSSAAGIVLQKAAQKASLTFNNVDRNDVGIWITNTTRATVARNGIDDSVGDGLLVENVNTVGNEVTGAHQIQRNRMVRSGGAGIRLSSATDSSVYLNEVMDSGQGGIVLDAACDVHGPPACGATLPPSRDNVVSQNRTDHNTGVGIVDESTGKRTAGTANTYRSNLCQGDTLGDSSPPGLCR